MIVDGKPVTCSQAKELNRQLDEAFGNAHHIVTESNEVFLDLCDGAPDSVEVVVGGETIHIHDRNGDTPVYLEECLCDESGCVIGRKHTDLAFRPAYRAAARLSDVPRIEMPENDYLIAIALKCAAATSEDHGHSEQALSFRRIWKNLESQYEI